jgi:hypothetical protein
MRARVREREGERERGARRSRDGPAQVTAKLVQKYLTAENEFGVNFVRADVT